MIIAPGSTDVTTYFKLVHPTTGVPVTGATIASLTASYTRDRAAAVTATLTALAQVTTAHTDNYAIQVDATNDPGLYRVDWPDAAFASGSARVQLCVNGAAVDPAYIEVELAAWLTPITGDGINSVSGSVGSVAGDVAGKVLGGGSGVLAGVGVQADMQQMDGSTTPVDNLVLALGNTDGIVAHPQGIADALKLAPTTGAPAAGSVNKHLDDMLAYGGGSGTGTYTDTIAVGATPLDGVRVQLSTDAPGSNRVYETYTNALGVFTMNPDPGTYYRWLDLAGYDFAQGVAVVVT